MDVARTHRNRSFAQSHQGRASKPKDASSPLKGGRKRGDSVQGSTPLADSLLMVPKTIQRAVDFVSQLAKSESSQQLLEVNKLEGRAKKLKTPADFKAQTERFKQRLAQGESLESLKVEAYAVAREAAVQATGMRPYDCQVLGALAMDSGQIAEMMTGEGKTLAAVMPLYLNALAGKGAHLVTVNDTLAQRDSKEMAPIFERLGLSVGTVLQDMNPQEKRAGYASDITYTTSQAIGFDHLRDRTAKSLDARLQRPLFFALIDEVDEALLDEARTPLIISGKGHPASLDYVKFDKIAKELIVGTDYFVDRERNTAWLSESGFDFVENELFFDKLSQKDPLSVATYHRRRGAIRAYGKAAQELQVHQSDRPGLFSFSSDSDWDAEEQRLKKNLSQAQAKKDQYPIKYSLYSEDKVHQVGILQAALKANSLFKEGVDYLVCDGEVKIVDENKGRTSKGRRFNAGLHQALEAKSGVPIRAEQRPVASITYPNLFKHYERVSGMSGTAKSSEGELQKLYNLDVVEVPTNLQFKLDPLNPEEARRHNRVDLTDKIFATKKAKFDAVVDEALLAYKEGVPVLVGTASVESNKYVYTKLLQAGVHPDALQLLNAEHVQGDKTLENDIIAQAGLSGEITIVTNMAGRGANFKADQTNFKKMAMGIEQAVSERKAVVVDVDSQKQADRVAAWLEGYYPYEIGEQGSGTAGETLIRIRSKESVPAGVVSLKSTDFSTGLYVIGTERAKSRRIDDQLIGRSARQGKTGKSQFFLSLEDDLFRDFGGQQLGAALQVFAAGAQGLESNIAQDLVAKVQEKVGNLHFESREQVAKKDEVLNLQRELFYTLRDQILDPKTKLRPRMVGDSQEVIKAEVLAALPQGQDKFESNNIRKALAQVSANFRLPLDWPNDGAVSRSEIERDIDYQVHRQLHKSLGSFDHMKVKVDDIYRQELLGTYDEVWSEHLESMDQLKQSVQWLSVSGEKPEEAYKVRGFDVFQRTFLEIQRRSVADSIPQIVVGAKMLETEKSQSEHDDL